jgi:hypothetical protein
MSSKLNDALNGHIGVLNSFNSSLLLYSHCPNSFCLYCSLPFTPELIIRFEPIDFEIYFL